MKKKVEEQLKQLEKDQLIDILLKQLEQLNELRGYDCGIRRCHLEKRCTKEQLIESIMTEYFKYGFEF